jgi:hypothetical protein
MRKIKFSPVDNIQISGTASGGTAENKTMTELNKTE